MYPGMDDSSKKLSHQDVKSFFTVLLAIVIACLIVFFTLKSFLAPPVERFERVIGLKERDAKRVLGQPKHVIVPPASNHIIGFSKPEIKEFARDLIYYGGMGQIHVYINEEGVVFAYEYCGG